MALAKGMTPEVLRTKLDDPLAFFEEIDRNVDPLFREGLLSAVADLGYANIVSVQRRLILESNYHATGPYFRFLTLLTDALWRVAEAVDAKRREHTGQAQGSGTSSGVGGGGAGEPPSSSPSSSPPRWTCSVEEGGQLVQLLHAVVSGVVGTTKQGWHGGYEYSSLFHKDFRRLMAYHPFVETSPRHDGGEAATPYGAAQAWPLVLVLCYALMKDGTLLRALSCVTLYKENKVLLRDALAMAHAFLLVSPIVSLRAASGSTRPDLLGPYISTMKAAGHLDQAAVTQGGSGLLRKLRDVLRLNVQLLYDWAVGLSDEELRSVSWDFFVKLWMQEYGMETASASILDNSDLIYRCRVAMAVRGMRASLFEWRLKGARELAAMANTAGRTARESSTHWLTPERYIRLVKESGILSETLGPRMHTQLLKEMDPVVSIFVRNAAWGADLTTGLWMTAQNRHSTEVAEIFQRLQAVLESESLTAVKTFELALSRSVFHSEPDIGWPGKMVETQQWKLSRTGAHTSFLPRVWQMMFLIEAAHVPRDSRRVENPYVNSEEELGPAMAAWRARVATHTPASHQAVPQREAAQAVTAPVHGGGTAPVGGADPVRVVPPAGGKAAEGREAGDPPITPILANMLCASNSYPVPELYDSFKAMHAVEAKVRGLALQLQPAVVPFVGLEASALQPHLHSLLLKLLQVTQGQELVSEGENVAAARRIALVEATTQSGLLRLLVELYRAAPCPRLSSLPLPASPQALRQPATTALSPCAVTLMSLLSDIFQSLGLCFNACTFVAAPIIKLPVKNHFRPVSVQRCAHYKRWWLHTQAACAAWEACNKVWPAEDEQSSKVIGMRQMIVVISGEAHKNNIVTTTAVLSTAPLVHGPTLVQAALHHFLEREGVALTQVPGTPESVVAFAEAASAANATGPFMLDVDRMPRVAALINAAARVEAAAEECVSRPDAETDMVLHLRESHCEDAAAQSDKFNPFPFLEDWESVCVDGGFTQATRSTMALHRPATAAFQTTVIAALGAASGDLGADGTRAAHVALSLLSIIRACAGRAATSVRRPAVGDVTSAQVDSLFKHGVESRWRVPGQEWVYHAWRAFDSQKVSSASRPAGHALLPPSWQVVHDGVYDPADAVNLSHDAGPDMSRHGFSQGQGFTAFGGGTVDGHALLDAVRRRDVAFLAGASPVSVDLNQFQAGPDGLTATPPWALEIPCTEDAYAGLTAPHLERVLFVTAGAALPRVVHDAALLLLADSLGYAGPPDTTLYLDRSYSSGGVEDRRLSHVNTRGRMAVSSSMLGKEGAAPDTLSLRLPHLSALPDYPVHALELALNVVVRAPEGLTSCTRYGLHALRVAIFARNTDALVGAALGVSADMFCFCLGLESDVTVQTVSFDRPLGDKLLELPKQLREDAAASDKWPGKNRATYVHVSDAEKGKLGATALAEVERVNDLKEANPRLGDLVQWLAPAGVYKGGLEAAIDALKAGSLLRRSHMALTLLDKADACAVIPLISRALPNQGMTLLFSSDNKTARVSALEVVSLVHISGLPGLLAVMLHAHADGAWQSAAETVCGLAHASLSSRRPQTVRQLLGMFNELLTAASTPGGVQAWEEEEEEDRPKKRPRAGPGGGSTEHAGTHASSARRAAPAVSPSQIAALSQSEKRQIQARVLWATRRLLAECVHRAYVDCDRTPARAGRGGAYEGEDQKLVIASMRSHADDAGVEPVLSSMELRVFDKQAAQRDATVKLQAAQHSHNTTHTVAARSSPSLVDLWNGVREQDRVVLSSVKIPLLTSEVVCAVRQRVARLAGIDVRRDQLTVASEGKTFLPNGIFVLPGLPLSQSWSPPSSLQPFPPLVSSSSLSSSQAGRGYGDAVPLLATILTGRHPKPLLLLGEDVSAARLYAKAGDGHIANMWSVLLERSAERGALLLPPEAWVGPWREADRWALHVYVDTPSVHTDVVQTELVGDGMDVEEGSAPKHELLDGVMLTPTPANLPGATLPPAFAPGALILDPSAMAALLQLMTAPLDPAGVHSGDTSALECARAEAWGLLTVSCPTSPLVLASLADPTALPGAAGYVDWAKVLDPACTPDWGVGWAPAPSDGDDAMGTTAGSGFGGQTFPAHPVFPSSAYHGGTLASVYLLHCVLSFLLPPVTPLVWMGAGGVGPTGWAQGFVASGALKTIVDNLLASSVGSSSDTQPHGVTPSLTSALPHLLRTACLRIVCTVLDAEYPAYGSGKGAWALTEKQAQALKAALPAAPGPAGPAPPPPGGVEVEVVVVDGEGEGGEAAEGHAPLARAGDEMEVEAVGVEGPAAPPPSLTTRQLALRALPADRQEALVRWLWTQIAGGADDRGGEEDAGEARTAQPPVLRPAVGKPYADEDGDEAMTGVESSPHGSTLAGKRSRGEGGVGAGAAAGLRASASQDARVRRITAEVHSFTTNRRLRDGIKLLKALTGGSVGGVGVEAAAHTPASFESVMGPGQTRAVVRTLIHDPSQLGLAGRTALLDALQRLIKASPALSLTLLRDVVGELSAVVDRQLDPSGRSLETAVPVEMSPAAQRQHVDGLMKGVVHVPFPVPAHTSLAGPHYQTLKALCSRTLYALKVQLAAASVQSSPVQADSVVLEVVDAVHGLVNLIMRAIAGLSLIMRPPGSSDSGGGRRHPTLFGEDGVVTAGLGGGSDTEGLVVFPHLSIPDDVFSFLEELTHVLEAAVSCLGKHLRHGTASTLIPLLLQHGMYRPLLPLLGARGGSLDMHSSGRPKGWKIICAVLEAEPGGPAFAHSVQMDTVGQVAALAGSNPRAPPPSATLHTLRYLSLDASHPSSSASFKPPMPFPKPGTTLAPLCPQDQAMVLAFSTRGAGREALLADDRTISLRVLDMYRGRLHDEIPKLRQSAGLAGASLMREATDAFAASVLPPALRDYPQFIERAVVAMETPLSASLPDVSHCCAALCAGVCGECTARVGVSGAGGQPHAQLATACVAASGLLGTLLLAPPGGQGGAYAVAQSSMLGHVSALACAAMQRAVGPTCVPFTLEQQGAFMDGLLALPSGRATVATYALTLSVVVLDAALSETVSLASPSLGGSRAGEVAMLHPDLWLPAAHFAAGLAHVMGGEVYDCTPLLFSSCLSIPGLPDPYLEWLPTALRGSPFLSLVGQGDTASVYDDVLAREGRSHAYAPLHTARLAAFNTEAPGASVHDREEKAEGVVAVGLWNQGATCYMNATLQQLFNTPAIRHGVLVAPPPNAVAMARELHGARLHQLRSELQTVFTAMALSSKPWYDPLALVNCLDNKPTGFFPLESHVRSQNDANEFFLLFLDRLGKLFPTCPAPLLPPPPPPPHTHVDDAAGATGVAAFLSPTSASSSTAPMDVDIVEVHSGAGSGPAAPPPHPSLGEADLFTSALGFRIAHQIIGKGGDCVHRRSNEEPTLLLSLDVADKDTVEDSLQAYVQGELLAGDNAYFCEACGKKVDTVKRSVLATMPDTLVLHLKRFDMDWARDPPMKVKINDSLRFGFTLDMWPYTADGLAAAEGAGEGQGSTAEQGTQPVQGDSGTGAAENGSSQAPADVLMSVEEGAEGGQAAGSTPSPPPPTPHQPSLTREDCQYELAGVMVHSGSATSGHYYSIIRRRAGDDAPAAGSGLRAILIAHGYDAAALPTYLAGMLAEHDGAGSLFAEPARGAASPPLPSLEEGWYEYNDERVTHWDAREEHRAAQWYGGTGNNRATSAFMLFFDRANKRGVTAGSAEVNSTGPSSSSSSAGKRTTARPLRSTSAAPGPRSHSVYSALPILIPRHAALRLIRDNADRLRQVQTSEPEATSFLGRTLKQMASETRRQTYALSVAAEVLRSVLSRPDVHVQTALAGLTPAERQRLADVLLPSAVRGASDGLARTVQSLVAASEVQLVGAVDTFSRTLLGNVDRFLPAGNAQTTDVLAVLVGTAQASELLPPPQPLTGVTPLPVAKDQERLIRARQQRQVRIGGRLAAALSGQAVAAVVVPDTVRDDMVRLLAGIVPSVAEPLAAAVLSAAGEAAVPAALLPVACSSMDPSVLEVSVSSAEALVRLLTWPGGDPYDATPDTLMPQGWKPLSNEAMTTKRFAFGTAWHAARRVTSVPPASPRMPVGKDVQGMSAVFTRAFMEQSPGAGMRSVLERLLPGLVTALCVASEPLLASASSVEAVLDATLPSPLFSEAYRAAKKLQRRDAALDGTTMSADVVMVDSADAAVSPEVVQMPDYTGLSELTGFSELPGMGTGMSPFIMPSLSASILPPVPVLATTPNMQVYTDGALSSSSAGARLTAPQLVLPAVGTNVAGAAEQRETAAERAAINSAKLFAGLGPLPGMSPSPALRALRALDLLLRTLIPYLGQTASNPSSEAAGILVPLLGSITQTHPLAPWLLVRNGCLDLVAQVVYHAQSSTAALGSTLAAFFSQTDPEAASPLNPIVGWTEELWFSAPRPLTGFGMAQGLGGYPPHGMDSDVTQAELAIIADASGSRASAAQSHGGGYGSLDRTLESAFGLEGNLNLNRLLRLQSELIVCCAVPDILQPGEEDGGQATVRAVRLFPRGADGGTTSVPMTGPSHSDSPFATWLGAPRPALSQEVRMLVLNSQRLYSTLTVSMSRLDGHSGEAVYTETLVAALQHAMFGNPGLSGLVLDALSHVMFKLNPAPFTGLASRLISAFLVDKAMGADGYAVHRLHSLVWCPSTALPVTAKCTPAGTVQQGHVVRYLFFSPPAVRCAVVRNPLHANVAGTDGFPCTSLYRYHGAAPGQEADRTKACSLLKAAGCLPWLSSAWSPAHTEEETVFSTMNAAWAGAGGMVDGSAASSSTSTPQLRVGGQQQRGELQDAQSSHSTPALFIGGMLPVPFGGLSMLATVAQPELVPSPSTLMPPYNNSRSAQCDALYVQLSRICMAGGITHGVQVTKENFVPRAVLAKHAGQDFVGFAFDAEKRARPARTPHLALFIDAVMCEVRPVYFLIRELGAAGDSSHLLQALLALPTLVSRIPTVRHALELLHYRGFTPVTAYVDDTKIAPDWSPLFRCPLETGVQYLDFPAVNDAGASRVFPVIGCMPDAINAFDKDVAEKTRSVVLPQASVAGGTAGTALVVARAAPALPAPGQALDLPLILQPFVARGGDRLQSFTTLPPNWSSTGAADVQAATVSWYQDWRQQANAAAGGDNPRSVPRLDTAIKLLRGVARLSQVAWYTKWTDASPSHHPEWMQVCTDAFNAENTGHIRGFEWATAAGGGMQAAQNLPSKRCRGAAAGATAATAEGEDALMQDQEEDEEEEEKEEEEEGEEDTGVDGHQGGRPGQGPRPPPPAGGAPGASGGGGSSSTRHASGYPEEGDESAGQADMEVDPREGRADMERFGYRLRDAGTPGSSDAPRYEVVQSFRQGSDETKTRVAADAKRARPVEADIRLAAVHFALAMATPPSYNPQVAAVQGEQQHSEAVLACTTEAGRRAARWVFHTLHTPALVYAQSTIHDMDRQFLPVDAPVEEVSRYGPSLRFQTLLACTADILVDHGPRRVRHAVGETVWYTGLLRNPEHRHDDHGHPPSPADDEFMNGVSSACESAMEGLKKLPHSEGLLRTSVDPLHLVLGAARAEEVIQGAPEEHRSAIMLDVLVRSVYADAVQAARDSPSRRGAGGVGDAFLGLKWSHIHKLKEAFLKAGKGAVLLNAAMGGTSSRPVPILSDALSLSPAYEYVWYLSWLAEVLFAAKVSSRAGHEAASEVGAEEETVPNLGALRRGTDLPLSLEPLARDVRRDLPVKFLVSDGGAHDLAPLLDAGDVTRFVDAVVQWVEECTHTTLAEPTGSGGGSGTASALTPPWLWSFACTGRLLNPARCPELSTWLVQLMHPLSMSNVNILRDIARGEVPTETLAELQDGLDALHAMYERPSGNGGGVTASSMPRKGAGADWDEDMQSGLAHSGAFSEEEEEEGSEDRAPDTFSVDSEASQWGAELDDSDHDAAGMPLGVMDYDMEQQQMDPVDTTLFLGRAFHGRVNDLAKLRLQRQQFDLNPPYHLVNWSIEGDARVSCGAQSEARYGTPRPEVQSQLGSVHPTDPRWDVDVELWGHLDAEQKEQARQGTLIEDRRTLLDAKEHGRHMCAVLVPRLGAPFHRHQVHGMDETGGWAAGKEDAVRASERRWAEEYTASACGSAGRAQQHWRWVAGVHPEEVGGEEHDGGGDFVVDRSGQAASGGGGGSGSGGLWEGPANASHASHPSEAMDEVEEVEGGATPSASSLAPDLRGYAVAKGITADPSALSSLASTRLEPALCQHAFSAPAGRLPAGTGTGGRPGEYTTSDDEDDAVTTAESKDYMREMTAQREAEKEGRKPPRPPPYASRPLSIVPPLPSLERRPLTYALWRALLLAHLHTKSGAAAAGASMGLTGGQGAQAVLRVVSWFTVRGSEGGHQGPQLLLQPTRALMRHQLGREDNSTAWEGNTVCGRLLPLARHREEELRANGDALAATELNEAVAGASKCHTDAATAFAAFQSNTMSRELWDTLVHSTLHTLSGDAAWPLSSCLLFLLVDGAASHASLSDRVPLVGVAVRVAEALRDTRARRAGRGGDASPPNVLAPESEWAGCVTLLSWLAFMLSLSNLNPVLQAQHARTGRMEAGKEQRPRVTTRRAQGGGTAKDAFLSFVDGSDRRRAPPLASCDQRPPSPAQEPSAPFMAMDPDSERLTAGAADLVDDEDHVVLPVPLPPARRYPLLCWHLWRCALQHKRLSLTRHRPEWTHDGKWHVLPATPLLSPFVRGLLSCMQGRAALTALLHARLLTSRLPRLKRQDSPPNDVATDVLESVQLQDTSTGCSYTALVQILAVLLHDAIRPYARDAAAALEAAVRARATPLDTEQCHAVLAACGMVSRMYRDSDSMCGTLDLSRAQTVLGELYEALDEEDPDGGVTGDPHWQLTAVTTCLLKHELPVLSEAVTLAESTLGIHGAVSFLSWLPSLVLLAARTRAGAVDDTDCDPLGGMLADVRQPLWRGGNDNKVTDAQEDAEEEFGWDPILSHGKEELRLEVKWNAGLEVQAARARSGAARFQGAPTPVRTPPVPAQARVLGLKDLYQQVMAYSRNASSPTRKGASSFTRKDWGAVPSLTQQRVAPESAGTDESGAPAALVVPRPPLCPLYLHGASIDVGGGRGGALTTWADLLSYHAVDAELNPPSAVADIRTPALVAALRTLPGDPLCAARPVSWPPASALLEGGLLPDVPGHGRGFLGDDSHSADSAFRTQVWRNNKELTRNKWPHEGWPGGRGGGHNDDATFYTTANSGRSVHDTQSEDGLGRRATVQFESLQDGEEEEVEEASPLTRASRDHDRDPYEYDDHNYDDVGEEGDEYDDDDTDEEKQRRQSDVMRTPPSGRSAVQLSLKSREAHPGTRRDVRTVPSAGWETSVYDLQRLVYELARQVKGAHPADHQRGEAEGTDSAAVHETLKAIDALLADMRRAAGDDQNAVVRLHGVRVATGLLELTGELQPNIGGMDDDDSRNFGLYAVEHGSVPQNLVVHWKEALEMQE